MEAEVELIARDVFMGVIFGPACRVRTCTQACTQTLELRLFSQYKQRVMLKINIQVQNIE